MEAINVQGVDEAMGNGSRLIDVRTGGEFKRVHAEPAEHFALDRVEAGELPEAPSGEGALMILCQSGKRAQMAAERLQGRVAYPVKVVEGGTNAWVAAGLPIVEGKGAISIERQVRILAGALVVTGVLLGMFVQPGFVWLSAFIGAGLIFAGVTDTCGMAMMLAKLPWNRG